MIDMAKKASLDRQIRDLYRLPLAEFIRARNTLAAGLKKQRETAAAAAIQALAKPSPSAWAVTQLLATEPARTAALLDAGKEARAAQRQAMAGRGAEAFRAALDRARGLVEALHRRAEEILAAAGRPASAAVSERLAADLQALAFTPDAAATARRGFLDLDLEPPGFEVLAGLQLAAAPRPAVFRGPASPAPRHSPARPPARPAGRPAVGAARAQPAGKVPKAVADGRKRWDEAVRARRLREVAQAKERIENAESEVARTEAEAAFRRAAAKQADRAAAEATRQAKATRDAADAASARAERARAELARAREALAAATERARTGRRSS